MGELAQAMTAINSAGSAVNKGIQNAIGWDAGSGGGGAPTPIQDPEAPMPLAGLPQTQAANPQLAYNDQSQAAPVQAPQMPEPQVFASPNIPQGTDALYGDLEDAPGMSALADEDEPEAPQNAYAPNAEDANWGDDEQWRSTQEQRSQEPEEEMAVRGIKPGHRNILGKAMDFLFTVTGNKPLYEYNMQERDFRRAMQGYSQDPEGTARRATTVNGPAGAAVFDNVRDRQDKDAAEMARREVPLRQMYASATPETFEHVQKMAQRYAQAYRIDPELLPRSLEEGTIYANGEYSMKDRMENASRDDYRQGQLNNDSRRVDIYGNRVTHQNRNDAARTDIYAKDVDSKVQDREIDNEREAGRGNGGGVMGEIPEGTIQTHKKTGARRIFRNGKWQSL